MNDDEKLRPICANEVYPLSLFIKRAGLHRASVKQMRLKGLKIKRIGRRSYVYGSDFIDWFTTQPELIT